MGVEWMGVVDPTGVLDPIMWWVLSVGLPGRAWEGAFWIFRDARFIRYFYELTNT